jgi:tetratricopeptide (TPR) repeat protein
MSGVFGAVLVLSILQGSSDSAATARRDSLVDVLAHGGIDQVYNLEFEAADRTFQEMVRLRPSNPAGYFFLAMVDWWRIMIDLENEQYDDRFLNALDHVVDMCDSILDLNERDVSAIFFKGGAIGFQGRLHFHRDDYLGAANAGRKALPLVQKASSLDPGNYDILLGTGIYNYYAEVIPEEYPIVKPLLLFIPPGDKAKGIEQLTLAAEKGNYASVEAAYFLMQIYYFSERDYQKALGLAESLHGRYPNNMLFHRYVGRCCAALGRWEQATEVFGEISARSDRNQPGYTASVDREAEYYLGAAALISGNLDRSLRHLYRCDELSRTLDVKEASGFMAMANLKIGNVYDLQSKRGLAVEQYTKVLSMKDYRGSRTQAEFYLKTPYTR